MRPSRKMTALAGLGLIVAVNAIVLVGVAYNRSGEPESTLRLTERELGAPSTWAFQKENSGLSLRLLFRVLDERTDPYGYFSFAGVGGSASWLTQEKLKELGFSLPAKSPTLAENRSYEKQGAKEVLLVLELDGEAYRTALERARKRAAAPAGEGKEAAQKADMLAKMLRHEEDESSRLFVVDAGLDAAGLRARYPDRSRYAVVHGRVHPPIYDYARTNTGTVEGLAIEGVNVPVGLRPVFEGVTARSYYPVSQPYNGPRFEATVAFGKRLEPWLTAATRKR